MYVIVKGRESGIDRTSLSLLKAITFWRNCSSLTGGSSAT